MKTEQGSIRVLGIDPGYGRLGLAVLERAAGKELVLYSACFETPAGLPLPERLRMAADEVRRLIGEYRPEAVALEKLLWGSNRQTAMAVSEARGAILAEAARAGCRIREFTPQEVKIAATGYGRSSKEQVTVMVRKLVALDERKRHDDEYDAIAVGLTCLATRR